MAGYDNATGLPDNQGLIDAALRNGCIIRSVPAGHTLLEAGQSTQVLYVVIKGCLRAAAENKDKDLTLDVFFEGHAFASMESFMGVGPSSFSIESVQASEVLEIPRPLLDRLLAEEPRLHQTISGHHRHWIMSMTRRIRELLVTSPTERYKCFSRERSDLMNRLPQYMIASMLGIAPETLSRIRRKIASFDSID